MSSKQLANSLSFIQIITPRSSPTPSSGLFPSYLSTSEFDPVLYREELLRKSYLSNFPIDRPDYLITIGRSHKPCSTVTLEVKGRENRGGRIRLPIPFMLISCTIILIFVLMLYIYVSGFVKFV